MHFVDNLLIKYMKSSFTLHQQIIQTMETKTDHRTNQDLNTQAKNMFIRVYERINGTNLYGYLPLPSVGNEYVRTKIECISICDKYSDDRLKAEFKRNF